MNIFTGFAHFFVGIALVIASIFHPTVQKPKISSHALNTPISITATPSTKQVNKVTGIKTSPTYTYISPTPTPTPTQFLTPTNTPSPTFQTIPTQAPAINKVPVHVSTLTSTYYCLPDKANEVVNADNAVKAMYDAYNLCQSVANITNQVCMRGCTLATDVNACLNGANGCVDQYKAALDVCVAKYSSWNAKATLQAEISSNCN